MELTFIHRNNSADYPQQETDTERRARLFSELFDAVDNPEGLEQIAQSISMIDLMILVPQVRASEACDVRGEQMRTRIRALFNVNGVELREPPAVSRTGKILAALEKAQKSNGKVISTPHVASRKESSGTHHSSSISA
jgi:hypothetical protein